MTLLQISEPGTAPAAPPRRAAVGIDLGTTNSLVATVRDGAAATLPDAAGEHLLPSVVRYLTAGQCLVGGAARSGAAEDPLNTIASIKRLMGRGLEDIRTLAERLPYDFEPAAGMPRIRTVAGQVSPVEVSAEILKTLAQRAEQALSMPLHGAVITVPAYFDDAQRQATKDAARLAGLHVLRLLNEPTAAAVAYGLDRGVEGVHAIYDLGGGTFDISILRFSRGVFEVLATAGDSALGGDDIDRAVAEWVLEQTGVGAGGASVEHCWLCRLLQEARRIKEALTGQERITLELRLPDGSPWRGELTRARFEALIEPLIERTLAPCRRALRDAGIAREDIREVVLVGGSTRVPLVRRRVAEFFGRAPHVDIDPDKVVAIGAAIQADILAGNRPGDDMLLLDVIPLSLGLETMGGLTEKIIPRNTTIPALRAQDFTTFRDGQTAIAIQVVQGERELVADNRSLARFELRGIPPLPAGAARIRVTFQVDADGLLGVAARELTSGIESTIEIKPSYGLGDGEIERMLRESIEQAGSDMARRRLRERQVEAERNVAAAEAAYAVDGERLLTEPERAALLEAIAALRRAGAGNDCAAIDAALAGLERAGAEFAARRMDEAVQRALAGRRVEDAQ